MKRGVKSWVVDSSQEPNTVVVVLAEACCSTLVTDIVVDNSAVFAVTTNNKDGANNCGHSHSTGLQEVDLLVAGKVAANNHDWKYQDRTTRIAKVAYEEYNEDHHGCSRRENKEQDMLPACSGRM